MALLLRPPNSLKMRADIPITSLWIRACVTPTITLTIARRRASSTTSGNLPLRPGQRSPHQSDRAVASDSGASPKLLESFTDDWAKRWCRVPSWPVATTITMSTVDASCAETTASAVLRMTCARSVFGATPICNNKCGHSQLSRIPMHRCRLTPSEERPRCFLA